MTKQKYARKAPKYLYSKLSVYFEKEKVTPDMLAILKMIHAHLDKSDISVDIPTKFRPEVQEVYPYIESAIIAISMREDKICHLDKVIAQEGAYTHPVEPFIQELEIKGKSFYKYYVPFGEFCADTKDEKLVREAKRDILEIMDGIKAIIHHVFDDALFKMQAMPFMWQDEHIDFFQPEVLFSKASKK